MTKSQIRSRRDGGEQLPLVRLVTDAPRTARLLTLPFSEFSDPVELRVSTSGRRTLQQLDRDGEIGGGRLDAVVLETDTVAGDGLELLHEIFESSSNDPPPVVVFSRTDDPDVVQAYYDGGAAAYLEKPGDYGGLADVVAEVNTVVRTAARNDKVSMEVE